MASLLRLARVVPFFARPNKALPAIALGVLLALDALAKETTPLTAIELYDSSKGAAYLQLTEVLINGKAELRNCTGPAQKIDKSAYGKLPKVGLAGATSLARGADGVMLLTKEGSGTCVVPANLKFEKDEALTPAELADRALLQARVLSSSSSSDGDAIPPFKPGVELRFVPAPDVELAEYLRAQRARSIPVWQDYLGRYPTSAHVTQAKESTATLLVKDGADGLAAYRKSAQSTRASLEDLKNAKIRAGQALALAPKYASASELKQGVESELISLTEKARGELEAYKQAVTSHGPGYAHLASARKLVDQVLAIDPQFAQAQGLETNIGSATRAVESSLHGAESLVSAQRFDEALAATATYQSFANEEPRIAAIVESAYQYHIDQGNVFLNGQKWSEAVNELQKAVAIRNTPEATESLKRAQQQLEAYQTRQAADAALARSAEFESQHQYIEAYEFLAALPKAPRALVTEHMQTLEPGYMKAASDKAKTLQTAHTPIRGRADEVGVLRAYDLLQNAYALSEDDKNLKLRLDLISQTISDYYLQEAKRYLQKPLGSGAGLGWLYLEQSQLFGPNRDDVRDERTKNSTVYQMRSKLSIRVVFRDQTSRRDSAGFADQMSQAIATGVETSGLPVKVVLASDNSSVEANFQLVGDVLQHRPILNSSVEPMESKYRFGAREVPNEQWNQANRDYEAATLELQRAQRVLEGSQSHGKKKEISEANAAVEEAEKKVQSAHRTLDSLPKTNQDDVIKPYSYTRRTIDLAAVVEMGFRILDMSGDAVEAATSINKTNQKKFIVLENVKPEDTEGVKAQGSPPDEIQFLNDVEIEARDALIKAVVDKVQGLPQKILTLARKRAQEGDLDAAGEKYILYLNSTPEGQTPERAEAQKFLQGQFNFRQLTNPSS
jgi:hypothetical protein